MMPGENYVMFSQSVQVSLDSGKLWWARGICCLGWLSFCLAVLYYPDGRVSGSQKLTYLLTAKVDMWSEPDLLHPSCSRGRHVPPAN